MSNPRSIDSKREEFRKYLENSGVLDAIIRILTMIMETDERDFDPLEFFRDKFDKGNPMNYEFKVIQKNLDNAYEKIKHLEAENAKLKDELAKYHNLQHSEK